MNENQLIPADLFCLRHNIEVSFIYSLEQNGLITVVRKEETTFIDPADVEDLEKLVRLRFDLDINMEGIEAITHLLRRVESMQAEMSTLKNRLRFYDSQGE